MQMLSQGDVHMETANFSKTMTNQGMPTVSTQKMETCCISFCPMSSITIKDEELQGAIDFC
jgi:Pyruvate/2-oxoacid:ferredoxin oxidoreductase delta subunit